MSAPPYMKWYIADYLADTTHLSTVEHGAYNLLLMAMWRAGGRLPRDDAKLSKIVKCSLSEWSEIKDTMMAFFSVRGGSFTQKRLVKEMASYSVAVEQRREAAKASHSKNANRNKGKSDNLAGLSQHNQNQNHKDRLEPFNKGSKSIRRGRSEARLEGASGEPQTAEEHWAEVEARLAREKEKNDRPDSIPEPIAASQGRIIIPLANDGGPRVLPRVRVLDG